MSDISRGRDLPEGAVTTPGRVGRPARNQSSQRRCIGDRGWEQLADYAANRVSLGCATARRPVSAVSRSQRLAAACGCRRVAFGEGLCITSTVGGDLIFTASFSFGVGAVEVRAVGGAVPVVHSFDGFVDPLASHSARLRQGQPHDLVRCRVDCFGNVLPATWLGFLPVNPEFADVATEGHVEIASVQFQTE